MILRHKLLKITLFPLLSHTFQIISGNGLPRALQTNVDDAISLPVPVLRQASAFVTEVLVEFSGFDKILSSCWQKASLSEMISGLVGSV